MNYSNNIFIHQEYIDDLYVCDNLIDYFNKSENKQKGKSSTYTVNEEIKSSTDVVISPNEFWKIENYLINLQKIVNSYIEKYVFANKTEKWELNDGINIQFYKPNQGFKAWHFERMSIKQPMSSRHLVFITYLNDVTDEGETEFYYQQLKIKPQKGLTVIFPVDWTFTHRGVPSKTQEKYIITGWFNFVE